MKITHLSISLLLLLLAGANTGCKTGSQKKQRQVLKNGSSTSVETRAPHSQYKSAFPGQTRAAGAKTSTPIDIELIDSTLKFPWAICNLPDGRLLITEKLGEMRIETLDGKLDTKITGLPKVDAEGNGGLLDVNIDPDFIENRMIYWDYAEPGPDGNVLAVAKGRLSKDETKIEEQSVIYRAEPAYAGILQYGSRILFDDDGNLFVSTGERSDKEIRVQAQQLSSALGKIVHITREGKPVAGGPFGKTPGARPEIYAYGFRNPEGMAWNPSTHELWEVEFGPKGGDEVNIVHAGKNYGWPVITYGMEYSLEKVGAGIQQKTGMQQPVYYWDPSISPSGIGFYDSDSIPEWKGNLFVACLSGSVLARLIIQDNKVTGEEWLLQNRGERFRAVTQARNGALYIATDQGRLYKLSKKAGISK